MSNEADTAGAVDGAAEGKYESLSVLVTRWPCVIWLLYYEGKNNDDAITQD